MVVFKKLRLGISYEGPTDLSLIKIIVKKVLQEYSYTPEFIYEYEARSGTVGHIKTHTRRFFIFNKNPVDVAVFVTDKDKYKENRIIQIQKEIKEIDPLLLKKSAIGIPDPHIEKWLLIDQAKIKNIFHIPIKNPVPYSELTPKNQLIQLQKNMPRPKISLSECYEILSSDINLPMLKKACPEIKIFCENIVQTIKEYHRSTPEN